MTSYQFFKNYVLYPRTRVDEIKFLPLYTCDEQWALRVVIKRTFFLHLLRYYNQRSQRPQKGQEDKDRRFSENLHVALISLLIRNQYKDEQLQCNVVYIVC